MRKFFTLILAIAATLSTFAEIYSGSCGTNVNWSLNTEDSTLTITGSGAMNSAPWINSDKAAIKTAIIGDGVTNVYRGAFWYCSNLKSATIGNSVTQIEDYAFYVCSGLSDVTFGNNILSIGQEAFDECLALTAINLPNSLTTIGDWAFNKCKSITSVTIPQNVSSIGQGALGGCSSLTEIKVVAENNYFCSADSVLFNKNRTSLVQYPGGLQGDYTIPNGVTIVADAAFRSCSKLTSIKIPNTVTILGERAFSACTGLTTIICEAVTPPTCGTEEFYNVDKSIPVYVPAESINSYRSTSYWKEFTNIQTISVEYLVTFLNWDGTELAQIAVERGEAATPPTAPTREGYTFIGWDKDLSNITENLTVTALFTINHYPVVLLGHDGTLLSKQSVAYNHAAEVPEVPARDGYTFSGWTTDIEHIIDTTYAIALYDKNGGTVIYKAEDGEIIGSENVDLHLPVAPVILGKTFAGWLTESADSENGIVLRATYTLDNPTTNDDVTVVPSSNSAEVNFPYVTGAVTYILVIRDLFGHIVCKIMFNANGQLLGIAFAPGRYQQQSQQTSGFSFTVEGLDPSTTYEYEFVAHDETDDVIETLTGSFTTASDTPTDTQSIEASSQSPIKIVQDNHVYILRGNQIHSVTGQQVK